MDKAIITNSPEETEKLGEEVANSLEKQNLVFLFGNLGSGKTTFAKGFAKGLRIAERIISPTFIIIREHEIKNRKFYHIDLYRIQSPDDIRGLGLKEILSDEKNIVLVEWAEKLKNILPRKRIELHFEDLGENKRRVDIKSYE